MKITTAERVILTVTLVFIAFVVGFFIGRKTVTPAVSVEAVVPTTSPYIYDSSLSAQGASQSAEEEPFSDQEESVSIVETGWTLDSGEQLDLNLATAEELQQLPGIGEVLAGAILEYREAIGGFSELQQLMEVEGIGEKTFEKIQQYLKVEG